MRRRHRRRRHDGGKALPGAGYVGAHIDRSRRVILRSRLADASASMAASICSRVILDVAPLRGASSFQTRYGSDRFLRMPEAETIAIDFTYAGYGRSPRAGERHGRPLSSHDVVVIAPVPVMLLVMSGGLPA
jgi:hypothetical protein